MTGTVLGQDLAKGTVYNDLNGNGRQDRKEVGIEGVSVSNGREVVQTDKKGELQPSSPKRQHYFRNQAFRI